LAQVGWWRNNRQCRTPSPPTLLLPPAWPSSHKRCWRVTQLEAAAAPGSARLQREQSGPEAAAACDERHRLLSSYLHYQYWIAMM
jgi:hypothetical protein